MLPSLFGHRGARPEPENTMAAFREAVRQGVRAIETDFHATADNQLVVMHDPTVDRMTEGEGRIEHLTLDQIKKLKVAHQHDIPTADDVLGYAAREKLFVDLEIKCPEKLGVEKTIAAKVRQHGMESQVTITADESQFLQRMKGELPEATTGLVMRARPLYKLTGWAAAAGAVGLGLAGTLAGLPVLAAVLGGAVVGAAVGFHLVKRHLQSKGLNQGSDHLMPHWLLVDRHLVDRAAERGQEVVPYGVNGEGRGERLKRLGVHGLITDYPERFLGSD